MTDMTDKERYSKAANRCQEAADRFVDALASLPQGGLSTSPATASIDRGRCLGGADHADALRDRFARQAGEEAGSRNLGDRPSHEVRLMAMNESDVLALMALVRETLGMEGIVRDAWERAVTEGDIEAFWNGDEEAGRRAKDKMWSAFHPS